MNGHLRLPSPVGAPALVGDEAGPAAVPGQDERRPATDPEPAPHIPARPVVYRV